MFFVLLFGQGVFFFWLFRRGRDFLLLFGRGGCFFCLLGGWSFFFLLFGPGTGVHSLTGLPGSSLSDQQQKRPNRKTNKKKTHTHTRSPTARCAIPSRIQGMPKSEGHAIW